MRGERDWFADESFWECSIGVCCLVAGCSGGGHLAEDIDEVVVIAPFPPFDALTGVELGMTSASLRSLRPDVELAGYVGYMEPSGHGTLYYEIPGTPEYKDPSSRSRLEAVRLEEVFEDTTSASARREDLLTRASEVLGDPTICIEGAESHIRFEIIGWERRGPNVLVLNQFSYPRDSLSVYIQLRAGPPSPFLQRIRPTLDSECGIDNE